MSPGHGPQSAANGAAASGRPQAHIAAAIGVSRKCVKTWLDRYQTEGLAGLHDRSLRPHSMPTRTTAATESAIVELRRADRLGPEEIGRRLGVAPRTVSPVVRRHGLPRLAMLDSITGQTNRVRRRTTRRHEHDRPGALVHMDVKKLGRIPAGAAAKPAGGRWEAQQPARRPWSATTTSPPWSATARG